MNTVGWGGGALGPLFVGLMADHGPRATPIENMSLGIAAGAVIYLVVGLAMVYIALRRAPRDILERGGRSRRLISGCVCRRWAATEPEAGSTVAPFGRSS